MSFSHFDEAKFTQDRLYILAKSISLIYYSQYSLFYLSKLNNTALLTTYTKKSLILSSVEKPSVTLKKC